MRRNSSSSFLVTLLSTLVVGSYAFGCGTYGEPIPKYENGVVVENQFVGINSKGNLVSANFIWGRERNYGTLDRQLLPYLDVQKDRACVLTRNEVCEVDLESGKILRTQKHDMGVCGVGIIDEEKVFLHNGRKLSIMDMESGKILNRIDLKCNKKLNDKLGKVEQISHSRIGNLLYVARPFTHGVAVVDLQRGELVKEIKTDDYSWVANVHASGDKLFVRQWTSSYGIRRETLFLVDLKTGKNKGIKLQESRDRFGSDDTAAPTTMIGTEDGGVIMAVKKSLVRYDAKGMLVGKAEDKLQSKELPVTRLIALRKDSAWVADTGSVRLVKLTASNDSQ